MIENISPVMLCTADVEGAVAWYERELGFAPRHVAAGKYAVMLHPEAGVRLDLHGSRESPGSLALAAVPYLGVKDIDGFLSGLAAHDVETTAPRNEGGSPRFASFRDPDGNTIGVVEVQGT